MNAAQLEAIEAKITAAKAEVAKAQGSQETLKAQLLKEHGVETIEEAEALEAKLSEQVKELTARVDEDFAALQVALAEAVV